MFGVKCFSVSMSLIFADSKRYEILRTNGLLNLLCFSDIHLQILVEMDLNEQELIYKVCECDVVSLNLEINIPC